MKKVLFCRKGIIMRLSFLMMLFLCSAATQAQISVSGTVSDASGPLPGVSITIEGTSNGTATDAGGNYTLENVQSDATLIYSYIGYYNATDSCKWTNHH